SIGERAFNNCTALTKLTVPGNVATIGAYAFSGCTGITQATLQSGVSAISNNAFENCSGMVKITVPESTVTFGADIFSGRNGALKMYGYTGSQAEVYANENGIPFVALSGECAHEWSAWSNGTRTCTKCGVTETCTHSYGAWNNGERTCAVCGMTETCTHSYGAWNNGKRTCTVCGMTQTCTHYYGAWQIVREATPEQDGLKTRTCSICGMTESAAIPYDAPAGGDAALAMEEATVTVGNTVRMELKLTENPGVSYLRLTVRTCSGVTLTSVENGTIIRDLDQGVNLVWSADADATATGVLATLVLTVAEDAPVGDSTVEVIVRECYNADGEDVTIAVTNGTLHIIDYIFGDANGDGVINGKDVLLLRKYLANYNDDTQTSTVSVFNGADANNDGVVNGKDLLLLRKYMANYDDETGTSTVILG
ncbi:MAG: leucine-rich repeat protein, partial [Clostridia bacterium]|nr:leucine-rich repeat protein [Clostridia bacterium]